MNVRRRNIPFLIEPAFLALIFSLLLLLLNRLPPDITSGQGLKKTFYKIIFLKRGLRIREDTCNFRWLLYDFPVSEIQWPEPSDSAELSWTSHIIYFA